MTTAGRYANLNTCPVGTIRRGGGALSTRPPDRTARTGPAERNERAHDHPSSQPGRRDRRRRRARGRRHAHGASRRRASAGRRPPRPRRQRHRLRSQHARQRDTGDPRRHARGPGRQRDGHRTVRVPVQARHVRHRRESAADQGRLLHRDRRPGRLTQRRGHQRQGGGLQPLPGARQLRRAGQLLADPVQPVDQRQLTWPGWLSRFGELLGGLAGGVDAPRRHQRQHPFADGLLHGRPAVCQRRLHIGLEPAEHAQRIAAAVADPQQRDRWLDQRRVEPGVLGRGRRPKRRRLPQPALHDARKHPGEPGEAVPVHRRGRCLQRPRPRGPDQHPRHDVGEPA